MRVTVFGKILSNHLLPMSAVALCGATQNSPQLMNSGDVNIGSYAYHFYK